MSLLASKSLDNIKEGYILLGDLESDKVGPLRSAIIYGLAKYEVAINVAEPKYLNQFLSQDSNDTDRKELKELRYRK